MAARVHCLRPRLPHVPLPPGTLHVDTQNPLNKPRVEPAAWYGLLSFKVVSWLWRAGLLLFDLDNIPDGHGNWTLRTMCCLGVGHGAVEYLGMCLRPRLEHELTLWYS